MSLSNKSYYDKSIEGYHDGFIMNIKSYHDNFMIHIFN